VLPVLPVPTMLQIVVQPAWQLVALRVSAGALLAGLLVLVVECLAQRAWPVAVLLGRLAGWRPVPGFLLRAAWQWLAQGSPALWVCFRRPECHLRRVFRKNYRS